MNYVLVSPHFPKNLQNFAIRLKARGVNVLGIGSEPYEWLSHELKAALTEYYRVDDLENLEEVKKGIAFLIYKHGPINRIESNNEYWLELDAALREQFNVPGVKPIDLDKTKYKSCMKELFKNAGVPVVEGYRVESQADFDRVIKKLGVPVIAKPDHGVGSAATYKITSDKDVAFFKSEWDEAVAYYIEPFVVGGELCTYDGLIDQEGRIVFETSFNYSAPTLDLLQEGLDMFYVVQQEMDPVLKKYGEAAVKAFGMKERFFHVEFFRLPNNKYVAVEYNNRLAGGYTIDLYNYASECDLYDIYAQIVTGQLDEQPTYRNRYGIGATRRDSRNYAHTVDEIRAKYGDNIRMMDRLPEVFSGIMGNEFYVILADTAKEVEEIINFVSSTKPE